MNNSQEPSCIPSADDTTSVKSQFKKMSATPSSTTIRYDYIIDDSSDLTGTNLGCSGFLNRVVKNPSTKRIRSEVPDLNYELQQAHRILVDLMSDANKGINHPFMDPVDTSEDNKSDYYEVIKKPMWLKKVQEKFIHRDYNTIADVVADIRLVLENCYRYYGPDSHFTKKGLKLEQVLEQKLTLLPRELRDKTTLEITAGREFEDSIATQRRSTRQNLGYSSILLLRVKHEKAERDKELKKRQIEERKAAKEEKQKGVLDWEANLLKEPLKTQMKAMWELPLIGHFFFLCQTILNMPEVSQFELERILLMPRASSLLHKIMTSLLSNPHQRSSLDRNPPMPYRVWQRRLQNRIQSWYKILQARENRGDLVFMQLGIEANFFKILGSENPLNTTKFHELSFHQRVWCIKGLCDYILHNHRTVQDALNEQNIDDMREYSLGHDRKGNVYLHFPQFCGQDLRIYRQKKCTRLPSPKQWGGSSTKKRKHQGTENDSGLDQKKTKCTSPSKPTEIVEDVTMNKHTIDSEVKNPPVQLITARRSLRLSKVKIEAENSEMDEYCCNSSGDESHDSDNSDSDDENSLEPDIASFEMVVDSVESLRSFMEKFKPNDGNENGRFKKNKVHSKKRCEIDLYERLNNLLVELEPWEVKLQKAQQKALNRLKKEWEEFEDKEEEIDDIWGSDQESVGENHKSSFASSTSSECSDYNTSVIEHSTSCTQRPTRVLRSQQKRCEKSPQLEISTEELLLQVNDSIDYPTRGKLKQLRTLGIPPETVSVRVRTRRTDMVSLLNGIHHDKLDVVNCNSNQNTTSQAKELYPWETLRQILVPLNSKGHDVPAKDLADFKSGVYSSPLKLPFRKRLPDESLLMSELDNLHHVKMDMLGAMQAATSLAKKAESPTKQNFQPIIKSEDEDTFGKLSMSLISPVQKSEVHRFKVNSHADSIRSNNVQVVKNGNLLLSALTTGVPKLIAKPSVNSAFKTEGKTLDSATHLQGQNIGAQTKQHNSNDVFSTSNSSKGGSSLQRPSQVLIPFLGQDGKSIVYRLNCSANVTKIANSQLGSLSHKSPSPLRPVVSSHLTHPQETQNASNRPRLSLTTKVPGSISSSNLAHVGPRLHPVEQTAKKAISLAPNVIKNGITFRTTPLSSELYKDTVPPCAPCPTQQKHPESQKSSASPMSSVSKVVPSMVSTFSSASQQGSVESATKFQRIPSMLQHPAQPQMLTPTKTTTVTSNPISLGQQQVLLVPIANQNGKTTYLQIPTQSSLNSSPEQSQSPTVSPTVMNSYTKGTMDSPIRAPQRLIPALSPRRQTPSAFPRKIAMTKPPPLVPLMARNKPCGLNTSASKSTTTTTPAITSANNNNTKSVMLPVTSTGNFSMPSLVSSFDSSHNTKGLLQNSLPTGAFSTVNHRQNCNTYATSTLVSKSHSGQALSNALPSDQSSECPSSSSFFNIAVTGSSGATSTETSLPGSGSLTSANIVSLISNNPTLASIVQKYTEKGHQVVIMQQGDNLVFQAVPSGSNSTLDCSSTASPMVCQSTTTTTTITSTTTNTTTTTQPLQQRALENIACTTSGTQVQYQQSEGQNASYQIHVPATGSGEFSVGDSPNSLSKVETNSLVCATEMDNVNQHSETEAKLGNTLKNEVGGKLVIIQDSVSNHQTYGLLLDNGQLIPLNVTIS